MSSHMKLTQRVRPGEPTTMASETVKTDRPLQLVVPDEASLQASHTFIEGDSGQEGAREEAGLQEEDAQSAIGVSMSHAHARLMSPKTPAAEKAAMMEDLDGGGLFDGSTNSQSPEEGLGPKNEAQTISQENEGRRNPPPPRRHSDESLRLLPSPWEARPRIFEDSKTLNYRRSASKWSTPGSTGILADSSVKRFVSSLNLPAMPKTPSFKDFGLPTMSSVFGGREDVQMQKTTVKQKRANTVLSSKTPWSGAGWGSSPKLRDAAKSDGHLTERHDSTSTGDCGLASHADSSPTTDATSISSAEKRDTRSPTYQKVTCSHEGRPLRRAASDQSLLLRRVTSAGSSLGDDTRWEHVQQQVNSRMQAIKDSLQDSNIKLPSMPALPNINLTSLRPEFFRPRARSDPRSVTVNGRSVTDGNLTLSVASESMIQHQQAQQSGTEESGARITPRPTHSSLDKALEQLTGDLVIMGGYRGSILRSAKPPHQQLWVPMKVGLNIRKVDLEVGLTEEDEEMMHKKIIPSGMLSHIGPIDMGRRLLRRLRSCPNAREGKLRVHDYGYDWRLSPHLLSRRLIEFLETLPCNAKGVAQQERGATVLAHSMGGLITRHAVNQRPTLFAGIVYAGVPQHCINILGPLRNGDDVLLSSKVLTAQVNFTLRTSFLLLPEKGHCFINKVTRREYLVDFFRPETWNTYALSPCVAPTLPPFTATEQKKGLLSTVYNTLPSFPTSLKRPSQPAVTEPTTASLSSQPTNNSSIQCTIPRPLALAYLDRTLTTVKNFKRQLAHNAAHTAHNIYPPISILYSTGVPTISRVRVACKDAIRHADAYDDLQFASGDGVCLARAAMAPEGYRVCDGGKVRIDRGHLGLLGDADGVGKCLIAIWEARQKGVGMGD